MTAATRDEIRAAVFAAKPISRVVTLASGFEVEVRQPSVGDGLNLATMEDVKKRILRMFCDHVYLPGTNDRIFEDCDAEVILQMPGQGDYMLITNTLNDLMDLNRATKDATKN